MRCNSNGHVCIFGHSVRNVSSVENAAIPPALHAVGMQPLRKSRIPTVCRDMIYRAFLPSCYPYGIMDLRFPDIANVVKQSKLFIVHCSLFIIH